MKRDELERLYKKSETKKDGLYTDSPWRYVVKDNLPRFVANKYSGEIFQISHGFLVSSGKVDRWLVDAKLKELIKR